jgi:hypothetical protein
VEALKHVASTEGVPGLYRGLPSQLFRTVLATALLLATKEHIAVGTARVVPLLVFAAQNPSMVAQMVRANAARRARARPRA